MSNGRYCCISRAERPLSSLLAAGAAPLVCPTINDCLEPNVKRLHVLIAATAIEAARLTFCVSRGTIGILNFTRTVRKGKKISGGRWPHGLMRIFAVGRENLDRFDNTNSRKSVDQRIHYGFSRGRLTNLSRRIEEDVIPRGWTIRDNFWQIFILVTNVADFFTKWKTRVILLLRRHWNSKLRHADEKRPTSLFRGEKSGKVR